ncbi:hypothetical protein A4S06_11310 [Erysipelotrichaceae bacterium MTC7]|nr:hypothetical protein A4S06_11310 [Erysipelotrichaceae bacterium MTC7]
MRHTKRIISKISEELTTYAYAIGANDIHIHIKEEKDAHIIQLQCDYKQMYQSMVDDLDHKLFGNRLEAVEEMFWNLAGTSDLSNEFEFDLLNSLIDEAQVQYTSNQLTMTLTRYRHN